MRLLIQHENTLDLKELIRKNQILANEQNQNVPKRPRKRSTKINEQFSKDVGMDYVVKGPEDRTLLFESRFESGNLFLA